MLTLHNDPHGLEVHYQQRRLLRYETLIPTMSTRNPAPRPILHPVNTLGGQLVTDVYPADHPWHTGIWFGMPEVGGTNFWGGKTYVTGKGYTALDNKGCIEHVAWHDQSSDESQVHLSQDLQWYAHTGAILIQETRHLTLQVLPGQPAYALDFQTKLANVTAADLWLASPASKGEPTGLGYGGLFWRGAPSFMEAHFFNECGEGEVLHGTYSPWLAVVTPSSSLIFTQNAISTAQQVVWFVKQRPYPGVCFSPAFHQPLLLTPQAPLAVRWGIVIVDGIVSQAQAADYAAALPVTE